MFAKSIKTGRLIVSIAAAVASPGSVTIARAAVASLSHLHDELSSRTPELAKLSAEIDRAFARELAKPSYDKPADARLLLPQMLETAVAEMDFAAHGLDAEAILEDLCGAMHHPDCRPEHVRAFRRLLGPILVQVCNDPRLKQALDPALTRIQMQRQAEQSRDIARLLDRIGGIEAALDAPEKLEEATLAALARRFGGDPDIGRDALIGFLEEKADDYHDYRAQIDALDTRDAAIAALQERALEAADRLDFDGVEEALAEVTGTQAEIFAESTAARARNALLRGRAAQGFTLFCAAADATAVISPAEPPRRRVRFASELFGNGQRFGGEGLELGAQMWADATAQAEAAQEPRLAAIARQNRALALHEMGTRREGAEGAALLGEAVASFDAALAYFTRADFPDEWAIITQNLATVLTDQAERDDAAAAQLLARAVAAYEAALELRPAESQPQDFAATRLNLSITLEAQAERTSGDQARALLEEAIAGYDAALAALDSDPETVPRDKAMILQSRANTREKLALHFDGEARRRALAQTLAGFEDALALLPRTDYPFDWAAVRQNMAGTLALMADVAPPERVGAFQGRALEAYDDALAVLTRSENPLRRATALHNLAAFLAEIAPRRPSDADTLLARAEDACAEAAEIRDLAHFPEGWAAIAVTHAEVALARASGPACGDPAAQLSDALARLDAALPHLGESALSGAQELRDRIELRQAAL